MAETRLLVGEALARYRILELIGRGGVGEVYRARDPRLERDVALKVLAPRFAEDEVFRDRLQRESRLAASLDHANVIPVYESGEADGHFFLAMRYVAGTDLRTFLRREGALEPARAVEVASQVAGALDAAHARGLVHRDVKPSNVLIDERGHCYLADFGLTQTAEDRAQPTDGSYLGTVDYVAPEQIRGDPVDRHADVYALGCLLFECLTGDVPYRRASDVATIFAHLEEPPPRASERAPKLGAAVDAVLMQAMAKDPAARQSTCGELVADLRGALGLADRGTRRVWFVAAVVATAAALAAGIAATLALTGDAPPPAPRTGSLIRINPATGQVEARYQVSAHPGAVTTSAGRVWLGDFREGALWRLEPRSGELKRITSAGEPRDIAAAAGKVFVASDSADLYGGTVARFDALTGVRERGLDLLACAVAAGHGTLWACGVPNVSQVSVDGGPIRVLRTVAMPVHAQRSVGTTRVTQRDLAVGFGSVWVIGDGIDRRLWRIDVRSGQILAAIELPLIPRSIAVGGGGVWVTAPLDDRVLLIDPERNLVAEEVPTGRGASGVAVGAGGVWVANSLDETVSRIDPRTQTVVETIAVEGRPREVAVGAGGVWVSTDAR